MRHRRHQHRDLHPPVQRAARGRIVGRHRIGVTAAFLIAAACYFAAVAAVVFLLALVVVTRRDP